MARSLACLGDKTTQGEIRSASSTWFEGLKAVAQSGDLAWCEVCKSSHQGRLFLQREYWRLYDLPVFTAAGTLSITSSTSLSGNIFITQRQPLLLIVAFRSLFSAT